MSKIEAERAKLRKAIDEAQAAATAGRIKAVGKGLSDAQAAVAKMDKNTMLMEIHVEATASEDDQLDVLYRAREDAIEKLHAAEEKVGKQPTQFDAFAWPEDTEETLALMRETSEKYR